MAQYTEEFLATARHGYENTDQPMRELSRELGIGITTLSTLAEKHGWAKRSQRKRGVPPAMQLLAEAKALAAATLPPRSGGEGRLASADASGGGGLLLDSKVPPTHSRCSASAFLLEENGGQRPPVPSPPLASLVEGGEQSVPIASVSPEPTHLLIKLEQILAQLIAAQQLAPANGIQSPQGARTLTLLIQSLRTLQGMRGAAPIHTGPIDDDDDDDMPRDLDEFRRDLARRIDAFVASRTDAADADGHSPAPLEVDG